MNAIGMDIGATRIRIGLVDEDGNILQIFEFSSKDVRPKDLVSPLKEMNVDRIGIGVAGYRTEEGFKTPNLNFDLSSFLSLLKGYRFVVHNDAVLGAFALHELFGMPDNFVYVTIGTGIGAGVFIDGRLVKGGHGNAHEAGHIVVDFQGRLKCGCGGKGHWEAYCSGSGMPRFYEFLEEAMKGSSKEVDAAYIFRVRDDPVARAVIKECIKMNASGLATIIHLYDPDSIAIGGGLALSRWEEFIEPSIKTLAEYLAFKPPKIFKSPIEEATLVGAALAVMKDGIS